MTTTRKLLNIDANAKTVKGQAQGYMTAILYLAPHKAASMGNVCPMAEQAGCIEGCLNTAGRGGIAKGNAIIATDSGNIPDNTIQRARIARTELYFNDRPQFMAKLRDEIDAFIRKAERKGLTPVVRLNGTSDIQWEVKHSVVNAGITYTSIFAAFPDVQFYDYTKIAKRFRTTASISNYHLSLSYSEANVQYSTNAIDAHLNAGAPLVVVVRNQKEKETIAAEYGQTVIDGDETDLRFTDPAGALILLKAKGKARKDSSGFVIDRETFRLFCQSRVAA